ncbi:MAG TPA: hypothetical protein VHE37_05415 [Nevskiaceae bacterium]|nr:hypothetical protein [Nevskiaceae bacterium]
MSTFPIRGFTSGRFAHDGADRRRALPVSPQEPAAVHDKTEHQGARILGLRFRGSSISRPNL